ncbi:protein-L-isoaspartate O-methyltransferase [Ruegeria sp. 2205SS24-7]|uniref:protein-L-isoaspartate O-methyltransferase family protein n=1 Tax=Ruegeria discodermiae TaxID=3064389 RepID=UPI0027403C5D|nr:protein-L-isoaspartate O-methyltransferase [Ruegeria sp. 2205SS24-7]MDP5216886.1 protein-L-isoaspartate O-methyltransferase [Ruegeria sp. 2205SS24-7]
MPEFAARRRTMVDTQVRPSDVTKFPIIEAMLEVPRETFVPDAKREAAYAEEMIDLGDGRVLPEPRTFAKMLDALNIQDDEAVLDVAAALGYSTAVTARLAQLVVAVEEDAAMAGEAQSLLSEAGADNAVVHHGPLAEGAAEHGPYDAILVQGGVEQVPEALLAQLKEGGRIACTFVEDGVGTVRIGHKSGGKLSWRYAFNAGGQVLPGFAKQPEFSL